MGAYMLLDLDVRDAADFDAYREAVPSLIAKHGGEYLVRGGDFEVTEGNWQPHRLVLFRFPDRGKIRAFFADPEYAELLALLKRTCESVVIAVDGVA